MCGGFPSEAWKDIGRTIPNLKWEICRTNFDFETWALGQWRETTLSDFSGSHILGPEWKFRVQPLDFRDAFGGCVQTNMTKPLPIAVSMHDFNNSLP